MNRHTRSTRRGKVIALAGGAAIVMLVLAGLNSSVALAAVVPPVIPGITGNASDPSNIPCSLNGTPGLCVYTSSDTGEGDNNGHFFMDRIRDSSPATTDRPGWTRAFLSRKAT